MGHKQGPVWLILALLLGALYFTVFTVDQTEKAIVVQLGEPIGKPLEPGFHIKVPLVQKVVIMDGRLLHYSAPPAEVLTADKKNLVVKAYAKWEIIDPLLFVVTVRDEKGATTRLNDIVLAELRSEIGRYNLIDVVSKPRAELVKPVITRTGEAAKAFGLAILDIRLERMAMPSQNERSVYESMRSEREGQARKQLAEGREEAIKVRAAADRETMAIKAEAGRQSQEIMGQADAEAARIYAAAFGQDPDFYNFTRTLEVYRNSIDQRATLFLSRDDELMWLMKSSRNKAPQ
jgi:membrane protease subunit HflC